MEVQDLMCKDHDKMGMICFLLVEVGSRVAHPARAAGWREVVAAIG